MAVINLLNIANRDRPATNPLVSPAATIPAGVTMVEFRLTTSNQAQPNPTWLQDPTQSFVFYLEESHDNGATWQFSAGYPNPVPCGLRDKQGAPTNLSLRVSDVASRQMRGHLETGNGPIRFGLDAETNPA